ncbi:MAG TPA: DUF1801 domain-containing protein [Chitinophagaceae bacterium]|nr:DUF1801 domain-containing protein [Chitinophagaceae bacterium]
MTSKATTPEQYLKELPADRKEAVTQLRNTILKNLPKGFKEVMSYGMLGYVVPHEIYPDGYNCNPKLPLGMMNLGSQKNFIVLHHLGIYMNPDLLKWFTAEYPKHSKAKLDMGKGCIRFKNPEDIPYKLIGELVKKVSVKDYITCYEKNLKR